jgi:nicotinic acid mononucleotide adenylyltransferase
MYASYAGAHQAWGNFALLGVSGIVALALPAYSQVSNRLDEYVLLRWPVVTLGRTARFLCQLAFNLGAFALLAAGDALDQAGLQSVGGVPGAAVAVTLASQGIQYVAFYCYARGWGDANGNVLAGLALSIIIAALGTAGLPVAREAFLAFGFGFGGLFVLIGIASDLRALLYPRRGIGLFFGTFNPFHKSHLRLIQDAIQARNLSHVVIHPTIVPRLHAAALARGEIRVARIEDGFLVYERTAKADQNVDYFPTGHRFLPAETRLALIRAGIADAGIADRVEVAWYPEAYAAQGFGGVIREIRRKYPTAPLHGIHGSDLGGMYVRTLMDQSAWIYPVPFVRRDDVSASKIRDGVYSLTLPSIEAALRALRGNGPGLAQDSTT